MRWTLALLLMGCSKVSGKAEKEEPAPPLVLSPSGEHPLTQAMVPLVAWVPSEWRGSAVKVELDGRDITDALGVLRGRWSRGGGADYIATLDLLGLEPGRHQLALTFTDKEGAEHVLRSRFQTDPGVRVDVRIVDEAGSPRPGRVLVLTAEGKRVNLWGPDAAGADPSDRDKVVPSLLAPQGEATMLLQPGKYRLIAAGGLRDGVAEQAITVEESPATLTFTVPRVLAAEGWLTADLHVHTAHSNDAFVPERVRYAAMIAAGLDVAVITDHNMVSDRWKAGLASAGGGMSLVTGTEVRIGKDRSLAHVNGFPLESGSKLPSRDLDPAAFLAAWRAEQGAGMLLQLNHPRGIQFFSSQKLVRTHDLLDKLEYTPWSPLSQQPSGIRPDAAGADPLAYDAVEIYNRFSWQAYRAVRQDWFSLMEMDGRFLTGTGNSDSHSVEVEQVGIPVNFVRLPAPVPGTLDPAAFVDAIRGGRLSVSTGPFVEMTARTAAGEGGPGDLLAAPGGTVEVTIRVRAAPWVPVDELRLVVNGQILAREDLAEPLTSEVDRGTWRFSLALEEDAWILAEAGWPLERPVEQLKGFYADLAPSYAPIGFTNPVRLDVDGDGAWTRHHLAVQRLDGPAPRAPAVATPKPTRKGDTGEPPG